jgi:hypothetical protein
VFYSSSWCSGNSRLSDFCSSRVRKGLSCPSTCADGVIVLLENTCVEEFVSHVVMLVVMARLFS